MTAARLPGRASRGALAKLSAVLVLLTLLGPLPAQATSLTSNGTSTPPAPPGALPHSVFEQGLLKLTESDLLTLVGGENNMNVSAFSRVIVNDFWPSQTRVVGLDIGWTSSANTTTPMPRQKWVDDFLTAADEDGISVAFYLPDWGSNATGQSWWAEVEAKYPLLLTATSTGHPANESSAASLVLNSPIVEQQLERDLAQLLSYYGGHSSWVGLISGNLGSLPAADEVLSNTGFDRYSISAFANSTFYLRTVNGSGYYPDGTGSSLWDAFHQPISSPELASGVWQSPDYLLLYNGSQNDLAVRVSVPSATADPAVRLYIGKTGAPTSPIQLSLVTASNSTGFPTSDYLANVTLGASQVPRRANWTQPLQFNASLSAGVPYWIVARTSSGNETNAYQLWYRDFHVDDSAIATEGGKGTWYPVGSAVAWVSNSTDKYLKVYPYQDVGISRNDGAPVIQQFETGQSIDVRTVYILVADKLYSRVNSTLEIVDSQDSGVVASVTFSQAVFNGTYWWIPITLPSVAHLMANHSYSLELLPVPQGNGWQWHYLVTNPPVVGFQGKARVQLFRLESYGIQSLNLMHIGPPGRAGPENGFPGATNSTWYAQSFTVSVTSPLVMVQANVEKYCLPGAVTGTLLPCPGGQHPGDLVIQVRGNSAPQGVPGALLVNRTIPETAIPWGRVWVNATGWDLNLTAGSTYWVVLSTVNGTTGGYYPWKEESAYQHLILRSSDGGLTWGRPREPADMFIDLRTVAQSFSVEPEVEITVKIGNTSWVSQSVEVGHPTNVSTVLVFLSRGVQDNEGTIFADVRADDGYGNPSQMVLATGSFTPSDGPVSWKGIWAVNLDYPITLLPGVKYWLVFRSVDTPSGKSHYPDMALQAFAFYNDSASYGGSSLGAYESGNAGSTWNRIDGLHTDLIFGLAYSPLSAAKPSINQLRGEIESRQMLSVSGGHLASAWQMFLASSTSRIESDLVRWLNRGGYASYIPSGNTSLTVPQRTWIGFDTNSPSLFEAVAPSRYGFDLYPVVSLASKAQYVIPPGQVPNSIPVVVLQPRGSMSTTTAANYLTVMSSLNRSVVFVDASPVELFGRLDSISGAIDQLSRMRSQGLSWPELGSSPGPWLTWYSPTNWTATGGLPSLRGKPLALLDVASMQLVWRGTAGTYSPAGGSQSTYLLRTLGDLDLDYSNVAASSETVYPNQALLVFAAPRGEEVWAVINSTREVESVTVNDSALPKVASYASLVAGRYDSQGWSSLPDGLLLVRFPSSGNDTVRVSISPPPQPNQLILGLSLAAPFLVLASAVVADLAVWLLYLRRRTRPGAKDAYTRPD